MARSRLDNLLDPPIEHRRPPQPGQRNDRAFWWTIVWLSLSGVTLFAVYCAVVVGVVVHFFHLMVEAKSGPASSYCDGPAPTPQGPSSVTVTVASIAVKSGAVDRTGLRPCFPGSTASFDVTLSNHGAYPVRPDDATIKLTGTPLEGEDLAVITATSRPPGALSAHSTAETIVPVTIEIPPRLRDRKTRWMATVYDPRVARFDNDGTSITVGPCS